MRHIKRFHKKGNFLTDNIGSFLLALAVALVGLYLIWAYILYGVDQDAISSCGFMTGSEGICQISCDSETEIEFENVGCKGKENKCCVLKAGDIRDTILPPPYGGNDVYNFGVTSISFAQPPSAACTQETTAAGTDTDTYLCLPGRSYTFKIDIGVENTGDPANVDDVKISAVPVVVMSGNSDTVRPYGTYTGKEVGLSAGTPVTADITISSSDSKEGNYMTIYPYVKCETRKCKLTDEKRRGIVAYDEEKYLTVKFVRHTSP